MTSDSIDIAAKLILAMPQTLLEYLPQFEETEEGEDPIRVQIFRQFALGEKTSLAFNTRLGSSLTFKFYPYREELKMTVSMFDSEGWGKVWYFFAYPESIGGFDVIVRSR